MNWNSEEDIMKAINQKGGVGDMDVEDELAALEAEVGGGKKEDDELAGLSDDDEEEKKPAKKVERHASDDDLKALENEGLDDLDEEEKPKLQKKVQQPPKQESKPPAKPQPKPQAAPSQPPTKPQPQINKQELSKAMQSKKPQESGSSGDLYPEKVEKHYHDVGKMTSLGVLEKEKEICDQIIEYKKKSGNDYDDFDFKKQSIGDKMDMITSYIQDGLWDFEMYKKKIKEQSVWESKLLIFVEKDKSLNDAQKNKIKERVNNRKKIIEDELTRNPEEEAAAEEEQEAQKNTNPEQSKTQPKENTPKEQAPTPDKNVDYYPEKTEGKYHNVAKMDSLGVLEKEKEICDIIIAYKKKKGEDFEIWNVKKLSIDTRIQTFTAAIENGILDFEGYKLKIKKEYQYESKLLVFVEKDTTLNEIQKKILKERVNKRKAIIEEELKKNPEAEAENEEIEEAKPKEKVEEKKPKVALELKQSLSPLYDVPKEKEADEIKRLTKVVTDRLNEYRAALDYFKANELSEQQKPAIDSAKKICIELKKIQDGKWKEVNEFKLPDPVTPEFIYGHSKDERMNRFKKIIKEYQEQKKGVQNDINNRVEAFKKLTKAQFKKIEASAKKDLNALKEKKEKFDKIIKLLLEKAQDKWVPAPLFIESEEEVKKEKINANIEENAVKIIFGKTTYAKNDRLYLIVQYPDKKFEETFNQNKAGDWTHEITWKLDKGDFKSLFRAKIHVEIWEKKTIFKDRFKGKFDITPKALKDHIECVDNYKIELESQRDGQTAEVKVQVRTPCKEKEYTIETKPLFQVKKIYPAFDIRGGSTESAIKLEVKTQKVTADDLIVNTNPGQQKVPSKTPAPKPQKQPTPTPTAPQKQGGGPPKKPGPPKAHIDKSEFTDEELKDPDCLSCLNTLQVLEFKKNKYEEIRNKIDGRTPRELMQRIIKINCKIQSLQNSLGDSISPQDYLTLLKSTFSHDKKLVDYFNQQKDVEKAKLVTERLPLIIKETEELMKHM